jgi:hypothetical protein
MMRIGLMIALAGVVAACGGTAGNNPAAGNVTGNTAQADAAREKLLPCSVQAHGFGDVLRDAPEPAECDDSVDVETIGLDELIRIIPDQHPAFYYTLAARLFAANRKQEAVFWFYAGQLRYRIRLACHPNLRHDIEPALFGSLQETVGRQINEYAGADPAGWAAAMERVRAWDAATRNGFEPKAGCAAAIADQREGMGQLVAQLRANPEEVRRLRAAGGLPNR